MTGRAHQDRSAGQACGRGHDVVHRSRRASRSPVARTRPPVSSIVHRSRGPQLCPAPPGVRWAVASRAQLADVGVGATRVAAQVAARRWRAVGTAVVLHNAAPYRRSAGAGGADQLRAASRADVVHLGRGVGAARVGTQRHARARAGRHPSAVRWPASCCTERATGAVSTSLVVAVCTAWRRRWSSPPAVSSRRGPPAGSSPPRCSSGSRHLPSSVSPSPQPREPGIVPRSWPRSMTSLRARRR